ncbi:MAG TPA: VOC family protein, partial [Acidimicrobiales bacterium]|nr:VOC family protein [Acidimicrobiales bacterium]
LAWEVEDMWSAQNLLMERGIGIGAVNIPGRHFFMHPRDTHGVLMEWTDDSFGGNERRADEGGGSVDIQGLAWVTAVVADAESTATFLTDLADARPVSGNPRGPEQRERTIDLDIGDVTVRLVTPLSPESPYAGEGDSSRLCSFALRVANLDAALTDLEAAGVPTVRNDRGIAATDPSATFGLPIEWTT